MQQERPSSLQRLLSLLSGNKSLKSLELCNIAIDLYKSVGERAVKGNIAAEKLLDVLSSAGNVSLEVIVMIRSNVKNALSYCNI